MGAIWRCQTKGNQLWRWRETFKRKEICINSVYLFCVSLIMKCGTGFCAPRLPKPHQLSFFLPFADSGPHNDRNSAFFSREDNLFCYSISFNTKQSKMENTSIGYENWQIIYRWKALDEENTLGQFIFGLVHCKSLASKGRRFECKI
jgi:hypothetical protein